MKRTLGLISAVVFALASIVAGWFLLNNLNPLSPALYSFAVLVFIGVVVFLRVFSTKLIANVRSSFARIIGYRYFTPLSIAIILILAVLVRIYFYKHFSYDPVSDPVTFYDAGRSIAHGNGLMGNTYPVFFPFLAAYDNLLGIAMKAISNPWLATIMLNSVFDVVGAVILFFLTKKLTKPTSKLPVLGFAIWLLNPFTILFSVLSLPLNIVNFFIISTVALVYSLITAAVAKKTVPTLLYAVLLGFTIGIGNCFRPVFSVALVALVLLFAFIILKQKTRRRLMFLFGASFVIIVALLFGIQKGNLALIQHETGFTPPSSYSGWSIFIGSNSATNGTWNMADQNTMGDICKDPNDYGACHKKLEQFGIERYKSYGITGTLNLFARKLYVFSSNQNSTYNANDSIQGYNDSRTQKLMGIYITLYIMVLFLLSARFFYVAALGSRSKNDIDVLFLFIALLALGFFFSDMFVETAERYAQVMYPLFIIVSVVSLGRSRKRGRIV